MERVDVAGMDIAFERHGQGPALVLLHGAVCDRRVWRDQLAAFADVFTVVAWDAPGCGGSTDAPASFGMADYADVLGGFFDALALGASHVLGHSWGSTLAIELCRRRPALVRSLVLVGGYAGWAGSLTGEEVATRLGFARRAADLGAAFEPASMPGLFSEVMPADRAAELAVIMRDARPAATRTMAEALADADLRAVLPDIDVPTLIVHGSDDARSPRPVADELHRLIPRSTLRILPGVGHECYLESPRQFEDAVREWLIAVG